MLLFVKKNFLFAKTVKGLVDPGPSKSKFFMFQNFTISLLFSNCCLVGNGLESQLHIATQLIGALYCYIRCVTQMKEVMLWS